MSWCTLLYAAVRYQGAAAVVCMCGVRAVHGAANSGVLITQCTAGHMPYDSRQGSGAGCVRHLAVAIVCHGDPGIAYIHMNCTVSCHSMDGISVCCHGVKVCSWLNDAVHSLAYWSAATPVLSYSVCAGTGRCGCDLYFCLSACRFCGCSILEQQLYITALLEQ